MLKGLLLFGVFAAAAAAWELPKLMKKRWRKETVVYLLLLITGVIMSSYVVSLVRIASPLYLIETVYRPVIRWVSHMVGR
ncbi:hypothetical protein ACFOQM_15730 [Paenibacillus sp. GCM10012307]|uniref:Uncharacterized protein n=1 Tax=Paenibacillus roseus TaxID=2798579 RepID=A0A934MQ24_9BACL|nr:hypothetical protein [Paenibacillus roseus]MBJ6362696.1 hypothetical protein [Paenibacillus roseus]